MDNLPSIIYKDLNSIINKQEIYAFIHLADEALSKGAITGIINAFFNNIIITSNGIPYIRINGLANLLRTGNSGLHRSLVYQGINGIISASEVIDINGDEYISGYELIKLIEYRINTVGNKKTELYLEFIRELYKRLLDLKEVRKAKELLFNEIREKRPLLKKARIEKYHITHCELTGDRFYNLNEVEFSHIESVALNPFKALDINNGLIILKEVHREITSRSINDANGLYNFCIEKSYNTDWINSI